MRSGPAFRLGSSSLCWCSRITTCRFCKSLEASLWGNLAMWTGFLVLYTGQLFGQAYRNTGLLEILLESIQSILPSWDQEGQAVALVTHRGRVHRRVQRLCDLSGDDSRPGGARI